MADEALSLLRADGVDLAKLHVHPTSPTGVALIAVSADGENQIVVAPGANDRLLPEHIETIDASVLLMQLEVPIPTVVRAAEKAKGLVILNLAPASDDIPQSVLERADVLVVNEGEGQAYGARLDGLGALIVTTLGARGARMMKAGRLVAEAPSPKITAVDTTGAGDCFVGALTVALLERRTGAEALAFACAAGAIAATRAGAQTSMPRRSEVEALLRGA
jgi:ribokinase